MAVLVSFDIDPEELQKDIYEAMILSTESYEKAVVLHNAYVDFRLCDTTTTIVTIMCIV
jgi:hypothetical protein